VLPAKVHLPAHIEGRLNAPHQPPRLLDWRDPARFNQLDAPLNPWRRPAAPEALADPAFEIDAQAPPGRRIEIDDRSEAAEPVELHAPGQAHELEP
jgi:hypothetical protein